MEKYRGITFEERLEICKKHAASKDGYCLSEKYTNTQTKLKWKCKFGHEWEAASTNVLYKG